MSAATIAALASLVTALAVFLTAWRTNANMTAAAGKLAARTDERADDLAAALTERAAVVDGKLEIIRVDVNSNLTEALERIKKLEALLGLAAGEEPEPKEDV